MSRTLSYPLTLTTDGRIASLPLEEGPAIAQSVAMLASTLVGERRSVPDYGIRDPLFRVDGVDPDLLADACEEWEERAAPADVTAGLSIIAQQVTVVPAPYTAPLATAELSFD